MKKVFNRLHGNTDYNLYNIGKDEEREKRSEILIEFIINNIKHKILNSLGDGDLSCSLALSRCYNNIKEYILIITSMLLPIHPVKNSLPPIPMLNQIY